MNCPQYLNRIEFDRRRKTSIELNIVPLIDIVFLLIVFFMLTSNFMVKHGINITLPASSFAKNYSSENLILWITEKNDMYLNDKHIYINELFNELKNYLPTKKIVIKADRSVNLGLVVKIMDIVKKAGIDDIVISTKVKVEK